MKSKALHPDDLLLRCIAMQRGKYWVAMCIDLDLTVQATTAPQARKLLKAQITSYVADAVSVDEEHAAYLLHRKAPLRYRCLYHLAKMVNATKRRQSYEAAMPLVPVGA